MKCLHIANDFSLTKVHKNLYTKLDALGLEQIVYNPVREHTPVGNNHIDFKTPGSTIIYSNKLKKYHRILFRDKVKFLFKDLATKYTLDQVDVIHATTLFSDGAVALKIYQKYRIPYIVAVRGTDVSLFLKYKPDLIFLLRAILQNAQGVVFLGEALKRQFLNSTYVKVLRLDIQHKIRVISNGIDDFWLNNLYAKKNEKPERILYIGRFDYNKNTLNLIEGILQLRQQFPELKLDLVGKGGTNEAEVIELSKRHDFITYHGPVYDKTALQQIYRSNHIFAMPSISETFGLVYLEALSQGLPVICSKNQGIDGSFESKIGEFVDPKSIESIAGGLDRILKNYASYTPESIDFNAFYWDSISKTYYKIYERICKE